MTEQTMAGGAIDPTVCSQWPRALRCDEHARAMSDWLVRTTVDGYGSVGPSWDAVQAWLSMAGGLQEVRVDVAPWGSWMCSAAVPYDNMKNETLSAYHTE